MAAATTRVLYAPALPAGRTYYATTYATMRATTATTRHGYTKRCRRVAKATT